jgi:hypothetical protein
MSKILLDYYLKNIFFPTYKYLCNYMKNSNILKPNEPLQKKKFIAL